MQVLSLKSMSIALVQIILSYFSTETLLLISNLLYSRTAMAQTPLEPWQYVWDRDSLS